LLLTYSVGDSPEENDGVLWKFPIDKNDPNNINNQKKKGSKKTQIIEELPIDAALNCIRTAMRTLYGGGQSARFGKELSAVDEQVFASSLFSLLLKLVSSKHHFTSLVVECVELVVLKRKE
jgi:hypothetical protein